MFAYSLYLIYERKGRETLEKKKIIINNNNNNNAIFLSRVQQ